ncbi:MAG TPA: HdeD family acid-resistance protein [Gemmataceae bacterium]
MSITFPASRMISPLDERAALGRQWWVYLALGVISVIVGMLAISSTFVATLVSVRVFGWLLLFAGITEVVHAVMVRNMRGFALHLLAAALYLIVGLFMLEDPVRAATVLTLLIAAAFFVGGILRVIFSVAVRFPAWSWVLFNGVVDLVLGVLILNGWPESSLWVIGLFVGIDLLLHGWSWVILSLTARTYTAAQPG